jgi:hypothetical protein
MAVYAAKRQGRNRVVVATPHDPVDVGGHIPLMADDLVAAQ